jgi:hypothetical protein
MYSNRHKIEQVKIHLIKTLRRSGEKEAFLQDATKPSGTIEK